MTEVLTQFAAGCSNKGITLIPTWYKYLKGTDDPNGGCSIQFSFPGDLGAILLAIVEILLRIGALVAVAYIIYGGFMYLTSQGEPDRAKNAQTTITNAIVGLVIALLATGVVAFIGGQLL
jgi:hypothetical protein